MSRKSFKEYCNEPAFPQPIVLREYANMLLFSQGRANDNGLSRLEYFTAKAMQGLCADKTANNSAPDLAGLAGARASATLRVLYEY